MSNQEILSFVKEALAQRMLYYNEERFNDARAIVAEYHGVDPLTLDGMVDKFLTIRKISSNAEEAVLQQMEEPDVKLFGATHYFTRKFFTTTYDLPKNPNPITSIKNVLDSLYVTDNYKAAKFLRELAELSSKDPKNQQKIVVITDEMVPLVFGKHQEAVKKVQGTRKSGTRSYDDEIIAANHRHNIMLDKTLEYTHRVIKYDERPSIKPFINYLGITTQ